MFQQLAEVGLNVAAAVAVERLPEDLRPRASGMLVLIGHGGRKLWSQLSPPLDPSLHPLDRFTLAHVRAACAKAGDSEPLILYPGPEVVPLQKLGRFLNLARPSLLGLDLHREFGPWFAYRAALVTSAALPEVWPASFESPCASCVEKPCQSACPAAAVRPQGFAMGACADYRLSPGSCCLQRCLARLACPVGASHRYSEEQLRYHMVRPAHLKKLAEYKTK